jgi:DNA-binding beta-propeller fold protein YncE
MNKKYLAFISLLAILTFIGYIVYDTVTDKSNQSDEVSISEPSLPDMWDVSEQLNCTDGQLSSVAVGERGMVYLGGDSFVSCFDSNLIKKWLLKTPGKITSLATSGDTVYASTEENILLIGPDGRIITEWGPYEAHSIITSLTADKNFVAFADAGNKRVFILSKAGDVKSMIGQGDRKFIIPSPYFDVALFGKNTIYASNTGNRRIETWTTDGKYIEAFGEPGSAPGAFCGCCNPAHFAVIPQGFVTSEKGINRIKIVDPAGKFIEFVSNDNKYTPSVPLDLASRDGKKIYAANPADSKLYIFTRK